MKRGGFKRAALPRREREPGEYESYTPAPRPRAVAVAGLSAKLVVRLPKCEPARHEGYRRLVAAMPCIRCGVVGRSQAAHPNTGKGMALKADDRECFPLCGPTFGDPGCHAMFDQGALYTKEWRRRMEAKWSAQTRDEIKSAGQWPRDLEPWPEEASVA